MVCFSSLIIGISFLFGFILLGIAAELYYLLCYKKRIQNRDIQKTQSLFFWKKLTKKEEKPDTRETEPDQDLLEKNVYGEEAIDTELMRIHNLCGPPRFLFTIAEEEREDLESEYAKSRTMSLSEVVLTPLASPILKNSFNPLFESFSETDMNNRLRASPPPKFKFLRDAEEKLMRRLMEEAEKKGGKEERERESSLIRIVVGNNKQVLPLSSSPSQLSEVIVHESK